MNNPYKPRQDSAMMFLLKALIPYTEENLLLAFRPNVFFKDLERISHYKKRALEAAYYKAQAENLIKVERDIVKLTEAGQKIVRPFIAKQLGPKAKLMIIFDIPEDMSVVRARLRRVLHSWHFKQIQKSVWITSYDHKRSLQDLVKELGIQPYVQIYECAVIK